MIAEITAGSAGTAIFAALIIGAWTWDRLAVAPNRRRRRDAEGEVRRLRRHIARLEADLTLRSRRHHPSTNRASARHLHPVPTTWADEQDT